MKTLLISAAVLAGCAAQPYQPLAQAQVYGPEQERKECVAHVASVLAFAEVAEPVLDRCLAGNAQQCGIYAVFLTKVDLSTHADAASACFRAEKVPYSLVIKSTDRLPRFANKMQMFNKKVGIK